MPCHQQLNDQQRQGASRPLPAAVTVCAGKAAPQHDASTTHSQQPTRTAATPAPNTARHDPTAAVCYCLPWCPSRLHAAASCPPQCRMLRPAAGASSSGAECTSCRASSTSCSSSRSLAAAGPDPSSSLGAREMSTLLRLPLPPLLPLLLAAAVALLGEAAEGLLGLSGATRRATAAAARASSTSSSSISAAAWASTSCRCSSSYLHQHQHDSHPVSATCLGYYNAAAQQRVCCQWKRSVLTPSGWTCASVTP